MADEMVIDWDTSAFKARLRQLHSDPIKYRIALETLNYHSKLVARDKASSNSVRTDNREIVQKVLDFRRDLEQRVTEGRAGRWDSQFLTEATLGATSFLLGTAAKTTGIAAPFLGAGLLLGKSVAQNYFGDYFQSDQAVEAARQQLRLRKVDAFEDQIIDNYTSTCKGDLLCRQQAPFIQPEMPALQPKPGELAEMLVASGHVIQHSPENAFNLKLRQAARPDGSMVLDPEAVKDALKEDFADLRQALTDSMKPVVEELTAIREGQDSILEWVTLEKANAERRREEEEKDARRTALVRAAEESFSEVQGGLGAVVALMGLVDPKLATDVGRIGEAAINVARASTQLVQTVSNIAQGLGAAAGAGAMAATGNFIGAAVALISIFIDAGPSIDQQILDEVKALREDMARLSDSMHDRFDRIDRTLSSLYTDVMAEFWKLQISSAEQSTMAKNTLHLLGEQRETLARIERDFILYAREGERAELKDKIDAGLGRTYRGVHPSMTMAEYHSCESLFFSWATRRSGEITESPIPDDLSNTSLAKVLLSRATGQVAGGAGGRNAADDLALVFEVAKDRGWPGLVAVNEARATYDVKGRIPNANTWALAAAAYAQLEIEWPNLSNQANDAQPKTQRNKVRANGEFLEVVLGAMVKEVDSQQQNMLAHACNNLSAATSDLGIELEKEAVAWQARRMLNPSAIGRNTPAWKLPEEVEGWGYAPTVTISPFYSGGGLQFPTELTAKFPLGLRAWMGSQDDSWTAYASTWHRYESLPENKALGRATLFIEVSIYPPTADLDGQVYRDPPVLRYKLASKKAEPLSSSSNSNPIWSGNRWQDEWLPMIRHASPEFIDGDRIKNLGSHRNSWCWEPETGLFPHLSKQITASLTSQGSASAGLAASVQAYVGAANLLRTMVSVAMPEERSNDDVLRAVLDGLPLMNGGVGIPGITDLAAVVVNRDPAWGPHVPNVGERPLADMVIRATATPIAVLRDNLDRQRQGVEIAKKCPRQPGVTTALARLTLAEQIVDATAALAQAPAPPTVPVDPAPRAIAHTVGKDETLASIARKFNLLGGWKALYEANKDVIGIDPNRIYEGMVLNIPNDG